MTDFLFLYIYWLILQAIVASSVERIFFFLVNDTTTQSMKLAEHPIVTRCHDGIGTHNRLKSVWLPAYEYEASHCARKTLYHVVV